MKRNSLNNGSQSDGAGGVIHVAIARLHCLILDTV